jgi:hypothetical protein
MNCVYCEESLDDPTEEQEKEMRVEAVKLFGVDPATDPNYFYRVCDDCWKRINAPLRPFSPSGFFGWLDRHVRWESPFWKLALFFCSGVVAGLFLFKGIRLLVQLIHWQR